MKNHLWEEIALDARRKGIAAVAVVVVVFLVVGIHDGVFGTTSIGDINLGRIDTGTVVTVKGTLLYATAWGDYSLVTITDQTQLYILTFVWDGDVPPIGSTVVVTGTLDTYVSMTDVTAFHALWLFG